MSSTFTRRLQAWRLLALPLMLAGCSESMWNDPYPAADAGQNILYSSFAERPKHLDPVQSYSSNEIVFTAQIYEPPLQYHYLKRPYTLIPGVAEAIPQPYFLDAKGRRLPASVAARDIATTVYEIRLKRGVLYQPHPAFARDVAGNFRYHALSESDLAARNVLADFTESGTRAGFRIPDQTARASAPAFAHHRPDE